MNHNHPRRVVPLSASNKRKESESAAVPNPAKLAKPRAGALVSPKPKLSKPASNNQLLAGYLAHEFLTKGTLLGRVWDPARARIKPPTPSLKTRSEAEAEAEVHKLQSYAAVTDLVQMGGVHLPGIVNPAQLAHFLQL